MSKLTSPTVDQDLKATGVAQVIVVLNAPAALPGAESAHSARGIESYFCSSERSQSSAVRTALELSGAPAATLPQDRPSVLFPHLGVVVGTVDREGLAALENSADVVTISGTPQISLIRPQQVTPAPKPTTTATWGIDALRAPALWKEGLTGKGVRVAHLDTGVDAKHPALKKAVAGFAEFEPTLGRRVTPDPAPHDTGDHGTHTAATIAGRPVQGKHIGVAHGAEIFSGLVIEGGNVVARVLGGLDWAIESRARIVSISLGFRGWWEDFIPIVRILRARGILPVIASGNEGPGTSRSPGNYPEALSVGAHDNAFNVARFSSSQTFTRPVDPIVPDLVAPGVNVISARPANRYQSMSGTSMATPHVAGLAALLWEADPTKTAGEIEAAIFASCRLAGTMTKPRANRGAPDAVDALQRLTGTTLTVSTGTMVSVPRAVPRRGPARKRTRAQKRARTSRRR